MWKRKLLIIVSGIAAIYALDLGGLALAAPPATPSGATDVARGAGVYRNNCATCHGASGEGNLGIPNLAGAAGHVQQLGIPAEQVGPETVRLLRDGIAGNMPPFPASLLSDEDIADLGAYLFTLGPTTGANLYTANCALCHGSQAQGAVGPPLAGAAERFGALNVGKLQLLKSFPDLIRKGIPGKMPGNPQLADVETARLGDYLWRLGSWEADFEARQGRTPTASDRADRQWSQQFAQLSGRSPSDQDWIAHFAESINTRVVTSLDVGVGAPPAGGWRWVVMRRTTGAADVTEVNENPNDHGNDWTFHTLRGTHEMSTPGGSVVLGEGEAELLPARGIHTHRFGAGSDVLGFHLRNATARPPDAFHRGDRLLYSEQALPTLAGTNYRMRARDITLAAGRQVTSPLEAGPSFLYVVQGTAQVTAGQVSTVTAGQPLSLAPTQSLAVANTGSGQLRVVLVDLH